MSKKESIHIAEIQALLAAKKDGKEYWSAFGKVGDDPSVRQFLNGPEGDGWEKGVTRRQMLKFMGASLALAGLSACTKQPVEKIFPYAEMPERVVPGRPLYFASVLTRQGVARGVLVESHMGRPTKVEGNPKHPDSLGGTDTFMQAEILNLYDPDRQKAILSEGRISTWNTFVADMRDHMSRLAATRGAGLRILTETITSPSEAALIKGLLARYPEARWHQYESVNRDAARAGAQLSFGRAADAVYKFDKAERIVALDSDFLFSQPGSIRYMRDYAKGRQVEGEKRNRLYSIEPTPTITGSNADHRFTVRASEVENIADHLARKLGVSADPTGTAPDWIDAIARDLIAHRGRSVVVPGEFQSPRVHALAQAMNRVIGAIGETVVYIEPVEVSPVSQTESLKDLAKALTDDKVELLVMLGGNAAYTAPADLDFENVLLRAKKRVYLGAYRDETARLCHWAIPQSHELEAWGDAKAFDGTISIQQPLIAPLYATKSALDVLSAIAEESPRSGYDIVQATWKPALGVGFDVAWRKIVEAGVLEGSAHKALPLSPRDPAARANRRAPDAMEVSVLPDASTWDGRYANNGWLQELPRPITTLTWDNVAHISQDDAQKLGVTNGKLIEIDAAGRKKLAPAWITPGQANGTITLTLGYGRKYAGRVGTNAGFRAEALRTTDAPWLFGASLKGTRKHTNLSVTQNHHKMEGREPIRVQNLGDDHAHEDAHAVGHGEHGEHMALSAAAVATATAGKTPHAENGAHVTAGHAAHPITPGDIQIHPSLIGGLPRKSEKYAWGMAIDLNACVGCNACTISCQAENNIPVVGKDQVARGREMHWIRVDRYHEGTKENPQLLHQPIPCMHCENAPCEMVCPVGATTHSEEGLNEMTYNRCVGTRYCSNNCPYKVRRYNFYQYADLKTESLKMARNPDVSVRDRGIMEKCTYCVQRINLARIDAEKERRDVKDGEIITACQQACPSQAITFGNLIDKNSALSKVRTSDRHYGLLTELNTKPRTTYLSRVRNLNPEIANV